MSWLLSYFQVGGWKLPSWAAAGPTVAVVAAHAEHHLAAVQVQRGALQQGLRLGAGGVDAFTQNEFSAGEVVALEYVVRLFFGGVPNIRHGIDGARGSVDHR